MNPPTENSHPDSGADGNVLAGPKAGFVRGEAEGFRGSPVLPNQPAEDAGRGGNRLLWLAAGAFAVMIAAWTAFFFIAHRHPVETVPVVTDGGRR